MLDGASVTDPKLFITNKQTDKQTCSSWPWWQRPLAAKWVLGGGGGEGGRRGGSVCGGLACPLRLSATCRASQPHRPLPAA